jgi:hypothetical protein
MRWGKDDVAEDEVLHSLAGFILVDRPSQDKHFSMESHAIRKQPLATLLRQLESWELRTRIEIPYEVKNIEFI